MLEKFYWWLAWKLPRRLCYVVYIRVYTSVIKTGPSPEAVDIIAAWDTQEEVESVAEAIIRASEDPNPPPQTPYFK